MHRSGDEQAWDRSWGNRADIARDVVAQRLRLSDAARRVIETDLAAEVPAAQATARSAPRKR